MIPSDAVRIAAAIIRTKPREVWGHYVLTLFDALDDGSDEYGQMIDVVRLCLVQRYIRSRE